MASIQFNGSPVYYEQAGQGKPVILLHGFGENGKIWDHQKAHLAASYRLLIPDLPGSGQSPLSSEDHSLEDYAELINQLAQHEFGTGKFVLIGHSMGGYISLAFAAKFGEQLNALGLFHSSAFADSEEKIATRKKAIDFIQKNGADAFLKNTIPNLFSDFTKENHPGLIEDLIDLSSGMNPQALISYYKAMINRPDTTDVLKQLNKPVLFLIGKEDTAVPLSDSLKQCSMPAIAAIHILQQTGHVGMWEKKDLSNKYLEDFLSNFV